MSLASVKSRLVLPFWYWLTWVVSDKGLLNGCVCVVGNKAAYTNETRYTCSTSRVVSYRENRSGISSLHIEIYILMVQLASLQPSVRATKSLAPKQQISLSQNSK